MTVARLDRLVILLPGIRPVFFTDAFVNDLKLHAELFETVLDVEFAFRRGFHFGNKYRNRRRVPVGIEDGFVDQIAVYAVENEVNVGIVFDHQTVVDHSHNARNRIDVLCVAFYLDLYPALVVVHAASPCQLSLLKNFFRLERNFVLLL